MLSMPINHPDIEEFIDAKTDLNRITKANISIRITDDFMEAVKDRKKYELSFTTETGEEIKREINAYDLFYKLAKNNWNYAEPGMLFWDKIENYHLLSNTDKFRFSSTNPCGEMPLENGGSCLLGSLNLSEFVKNPFEPNAELNAADLEDCIRNAVRFLNEIMEEGAELHPLEEQKQSVENIKRIGLGIMDLAGMLIQMGIKYGSEESLKVVDFLGEFIANIAMQESALIAKEKGSFPYYTEDVLNTEYVQNVAWPDTKYLIQKHGLRNGCLLSIAPTGSISTMLGCASGGIEPIFMNSYTRKTETLHQGDTYYKVYTPIVKEYMDKFKIKREEDLPDFFVTAMDINYKHRINMQATWQKYIDASISSTVNVPNHFTVEDVAELYMYAWEKGVKGITIYRDGCERTGILTKEQKKKSVEELQNELAQAAAEALISNPHECPMCGGEMMHSGGCEECKDCSYSPCAI